MSLLAFFVTQSLNALSQAALLFFLGVGLTLIFGIMRIVNFAHGTLYMLGAFVGYSVARLTGSFWPALLLAPLAVGLVGCCSSFAILRRLYRREASAFLMVTFGLALVLGEIIRLTWGPEALQVEPPQAFAGIVFLLDEPFPTYRLFLAGAGIIVAVAIWQFLDRTRLGLYDPCSLTKPRDGVGARHRRQSRALSWFSASAAALPELAGCLRRRSSPRRSAWRRR